MVKTHASMFNNKSSESLSKELETTQDIVSRLLAGLGSVIKGKDQFLQYMVTGLIAGGHILLEDLPGTGKTTAARALAHAISQTTFKRIQFTPDLLPYDITGVDVWDAHKSQFTFSKGPIFGNVILADEINRTTPKVQSALLEVLAEGQVTVGNQTYPMESLFFVMATQNPIEMEGTYPLPAAQVDRFLMKLSLGYPSIKEEIEIVSTQPGTTILPNMKSCISKKEILSLRKNASSVFCDPRLIQCAVHIADKSRHAPGITLGVSPRGTIMLINACRAFALVQGRNYVIDQDIVTLAPLVYSHRIQTKSGKFDANKLITDITASEVDKIER